MLIRGPRCAWLAWFGGDLAWCRPGTSRAGVPDYDIPHRSSFGQAAPQLRRPTAEPAEVQHPSARARPARHNQAGGGVTPLRAGTAREPQPSRRRRNTIARGLGPRATAEPVEA
eukprot:gene19275-biopygen20520